ncbi:hypothetical protein HPB48_006194 [Haemaphysalis longicornis]|uniref:Uncharacterized protein n=1 Tax=Haemaphysalis longicornis TaxID=44386 RepID=A0A9J6FT03_HAELO|nr:hypothetical protein HPB48_006194 [Haemaphysalis longicornis]
MGDPDNSVCRISHHARASLSHIENPYLEIPGAATNELAACYNGQSMPPFLSVLFRRRAREAFKCPFLRKFILSHPGGQK